MEGVPVPDPLRVNKRDSQDYQLPSPLQVGSPVIETGSNPFSPNRNSIQRPSQDRLSQLFPARTPSTASNRVSQHEPLRRQSFPSTLTPAAEPVYKIPAAPAPPSFIGSTTYEPSRDLFDRPPPLTIKKPNRSQSLLQRITSLRSGSKHSQYGKLEDHDDVEVARGHYRGRSKGGLKGVNEEEGDGIGYDISGFEGPFALRSMGVAGKKTLEPFSEELDPTVAGYAAEFHSLEAGAVKHGELGDGMTAVVQVPFAYTDATEQQQTTHKRDLSTTNVPIREEAQKQAEKQGEIVAVTEAPVDISNLGGGDYDTGTPLTTSGGGDSGAKQSYYFPEDPEQPSWRPLSMHWAYISLLIVIAIILAAVQEYLCQLSMKKVREGTGLLQFKAPNDLSMTAYFSWKYAPTLILVTYGILWQISDFEVKRLEPYYQLSKRTGATAAESLNNDYVTFLSYLIPLKAAKYKQWAVVLSSLSYLLTGSLVPVLQSASVNMYPQKELRKPDDWKYVRIDPKWSRAVSSILLLAALLGCILIFQLRRKSGLLSDPKGIAGIAAMATRSHILNDFKGLDTAPQHVIHRQLRNRRYILHKSSLWQGEYIRNSTEEVKEHTDPRPLMLRRRVGCAFIAFIIIVAILIPVFIFVDHANKVTEKLPWLFTAIATIVKLLWGTMDADIRLTEPFYILSLRGASPATLTLDYTGTIPGYLSVKAFLNKHYVVSLVGFGAVLTELLTVCVSSFSVDGKKFFPGHGRDGDEDGNMGDDRYNSDETFKSFWVSFALVLAVLLVLVGIASLVYLRRAHKFMPRQVGSIASTLAFIHQSHMLVSFVGTERMDSRQMTKYLEGLGKTYGLGWFKGRDNEDHCGIDEEPLQSGYKWGVDWRQGRMARIDTWEQY